MIGFLVRRFRWMIIGAGVKYVARRGTARSIDGATAAIEERLPAPVARVANALPGDVLRAGGAAAVSARAARQTTSLAARTTSSVVRTTGGVARFVPGQRRRLADRLAAARSDFGDATEAARRELKSDYARHFEGDGAALEALLDLRDVEADPIPPVPAPVEGGRRRYRRELPSRPVARVQRSYKRPVKPWDRRSLMTDRRRANGGDETPHGR